VFVAHCVCLEYGLIKLNQDTSILSSPSLLPMLAMLSATTNKKRWSNLLQQGYLFFLFLFIFLYFCAFMLFLFGFLGFILF